MACRSSRFLEETRSSSPWICALTPLGPSSRISLEIFLASSELMPSLRAIPILLAGPDWRGSDGVEDLEADLALDQLLLEHLEDGAGAVVGGGADLDGLLALPRDGGAGALEVEPRRDLARGLAQRVVHLLAVDLAHDVERRVGHAVSPCDSVARCALRYCFASLSTGQAGSGDIPGRLPERPMGADCKSVGVFLRRFESCTCHQLKRPHVRPGGSQLRSMSSSSAAWARVWPSTARPASRRAIGTRKGEQET